MKALRKVYVKPALPLRKAKNTSLQDYKIVKLLGQGGFGQVHLVKALKENKQLMALKKILLCFGNNQPHMTEQKRLRVMRETQIMETMRHPHIVNMHAHFIDAEIIETVNEETGEVKTQEKWYLCIVMEHASKGDLLHLIERHKENRNPISEKDIWMVSSQIALGLQYLHAN